MSSARGLVYDRYYVGAHAEWLMRIGPESGAPILFVPPLFEEMNRTRALIVSVMRTLASAGYCCWLPDLPGTGESERALETCSWADWREAVRLAADRVRSGRTLVVASVRGGALLDDIPDAAQWRFSPVEGRSLLRDLSRSGLTGGDGAAGYPMSSDLSAGLAAAGLAPVPLSRIVRLTADRQSADARVDGPALWRRSEPGTSSELAELISSDILTWASKCAS